MHANSICAHRSNTVGNRYRLQLLHVIPKQFERCASLVVQVNYCPYVQVLKHCNPDPVAEILFQATGLLVLPGC